MDKQHFQIVLYILFGFLIVVGFGSLALYGQLKKGGSDPQPGNSAAPEEREDIELVVWGTVDSGKAEPLLALLPRSEAYGSMRYEEKRFDVLREHYEEAVAYDRRVPDLLLVESGEVFEFESILRVIPFGYGSLLSIADYQRIFSPMTNVFLRPGGYLALPVLSDSMVLFYNENLRRHHNLRDIPGVWSDFAEGRYLDIIKEYRDSGTAVVPLGAYGNYANAPYLFAALFLQAREGKYSGTSVAEILDFYTAFADIRSSAYAWNDTFLDARDKFVGGSLMFYPGFVSEYSALQRSNPNIVIRAAPLPQVYPERAEVVPAKLYAFALTQKGRYYQPALSALVNTISLVATSPLRVFDTVKLLPPVQDSIDTTRISCTRNSQCPSNSCNPRTYTCDLLPPYAQCSLHSQCSSGSCNPVTKQCDPVPQRVADEEVFADALFVSRRVPLTHAERQSLLDVIKSVVVGTRTSAQVTGMVQDFFQ